MNNIVQILSSELIFEGLSEQNLNRFKYLQIISGFAQNTFFPISSKFSNRVSYLLVGDWQELSIPMKGDLFLSANNAILTNLS